MNIYKTLNHPTEQPTKIGEGVPFERIRRITGYLVGDLKRFNDGKLAEVKDRVKHNVSSDRI